MPTVKYESPAAQDKFRVAAKTRLIELGMTVTELASSLGISRTAVSQAINSGIHQPTRKAIALYLKIPLDE